MSASYQVFNLSPQLDAVIGSVSMIPVELTVFGIVSMGLTLSEMATSKFFHVALHVEPVTLRLSEGV